MGRIAYLRSRKRQMDKLKKAVFGIISVLITAIAVCVCGIGLPVTEAYADTSARVLYANTPLTDGNGTVIASLESDTAVEITGNAADGLGYPVKAGELSGFIRTEFLYFAPESIDGLHIISVKALAPGVGKEVELKTAPSEDAETAVTVSDGVRLDVTECGSEDYYRIVGTEYPYYILKENVTDSLTRNQRVAVIIISVTAVAAAVSFGLIYLHRNRDRFKNKR